MQKSIPFMQLRGGSSKGIFFKATDLPTDLAEREKVVLAAMEGVGIGDPRQIDGLGGANSLTSKVAIISLSENAPISKSAIPILDYFFMQIMVGKGKISTTQTCGNILAGVVPFAIESGLINATHPTTTAKVNIVNTGGTCEVVVETPNGQVNYTNGTAKVDGVLGTAAPIVCNYLDTEGATCGKLLPTGNVIDVIDEIEMTLIDNGMPLVIMRAKDFGLTGFESKKELDENENLKKQIENIRLKAGFLMNLGDVKDQSIPKMCLIAPPQYNGVLTTRMFIPHVVHEAIGVLAAVSVATACILPNSITEGIAQLTHNSQLITHNLSIEHPTGEFTANLDFEFIDNQLVIQKSGVLRTARLISKGEVFIS